MRKVRLKSTASAGPLIDSAGNILQMPEENIEEFNRFSASVFTKENLENMPIGAVEGFKDECLLELDINEEMVIEKLQKLRQDKAGGADELVPRLLVLIKDEISYPLTVLFKKSLAEGVVPEDWKGPMCHQYTKKGIKISQRIIDH